MKLGWGCVLLGAIGLAGCGPSGGVGTTTGAGQDNFFVTWGIESARVGPLACEEVGAATVDLDGVDLESGSRVIFTFPCRDGQGTSGLLDVGRFDVLLDLNDPTGAVLSQAEVGAENGAWAGTLDLGHVIFEVP